VSSGVVIPETWSTRLFTGRAMPGRTPPARSRYRAKTPVLNGPRSHAASFEMPNPMARENAATSSARAFDRRSTAGRAATSFRQAGTITAASIAGDTT
jgi:hypothetical protein